MINKKAIMIIVKVLLTTLLFCDLQAQTIINQSSEFSPSTVQLQSEKYVDFKPGYRAAKGSVIKVIIEPIDYDICTPHLSEFINNSDDLFLLGNSDKGVDNNISVYPNPFIDQISIKVNLLKEGPVRIDIFSLQGRLIRNVVNVKDYVIGDALFEINLNDLDNGMYLIQVNTNSFSGSQKIIK